MGIAKKLSVSFILGTALLGISAGTAYFIMNDLVGGMNELKTLSRKVELTADLQLQFRMLLKPLNEYLIEGDPVERDHYDGMITSISSLLEELKRHRGGAEWKKVLADVVDGTIILGSMAVELLYTETPVGNKEAALLMRRINSLSERLIQDVEKFHNISREEMKKAEEAAKARAKRAYATFAAAIVINLLSLPLLFFYLTRYVKRPLIELHEGVKAIREGRLNQRLRIRTGDEIETLADSFNEMASSLAKAKRELDRRVLELYALYNISKVLNTTFETEQLLMKLVNDISRNLDIQRVMIMLLNDTRQELYSASCTDFEKEQPAELRRKVGEGLYGLVAQTGRPRLIRDVDIEADLPKEDILAPDIQSIIAVPFGRRDRILGVLCAFKDRPKMFEWHDLELLGTVAEHVAIALENARLYQETKHQAITDGLTGLHNHRFFREHLRIELERTERYNHPLSLIILDIDHFKQYNDAWGHLRGDELLTSLAELLRKSIRESDTACRYGGEEFAIVLPETSKDAALALAERIRKAVSGYPFPHGERQPMGMLSISIGVASAPDDGKEIDDLIKKADDALYRAKNEGRNRVVGDA